MARNVRLTPAAEADLSSLLDWIGAQASTEVATRYVGHILDYIEGFDLFPERGCLRDDLRPGLRMIGFRRRVTIAFIVEAEEVIILRLLYAGKSFEAE